MTEFLIPHFDYTKYASMLLKAQTVSREKIGKLIGLLDEETMLAVNRALAVFLGFA